MSVRSIIEINHDYSHRIRENPEEFMRALSLFMNSADKKSADELEHFGVRWLTTRHHSDGVDLRINGHQAYTEKRTS